MKQTAAALVMLFAVATAASASMPVPVDVQTEIFINVGKLDRNFDPDTPPIIAILFQAGYPESVSVKDAVMAAAKNLKLPIACLPLEVGSAALLRKRLGETQANVVYVAPLRAVDIAQIGAITRQRGIRSVTGVPEYVALGISVGVGLRNQRPLILINLEAARAEGSSFSSQLLALARIVGPVR